MADIHVSKCQASNRPGIKTCNQCGEPFAKKDRIVVVEIETSEYRGDDIVKAYHRSPCWGIACRVYQRLDDFANRR